MKRLILPLIFVFFLGCVPSASQPDVVRLESSPAAMPERIISTLPSITEVLFDIGLGDKIVGDSSYTKYPPETAGISKIGGLFNVNREKIISLKPDIVILSVENENLRQLLSIPTCIVDHRTLAGVLDSYLIIGNLFGGDVLLSAQKKRQELIGKLYQIESKNLEKKPIRTLICIDRSRGTGRIQNLYVAGANSFLTEAVTKAGGESVTASHQLLAPVLSVEGILDLSPDVIIDIQVSDAGAGLFSSEEDWQSLGASVPAVRNRRILTLTDDFASIPGPRTPMLIEKIARYFESIQDAF